MKKCKIAFVMRISLIATIMIVSFTVGVYANDIIKTITAQLRPDFTIIIDNEKQVFKNADGKIVYPLLYDGTTYLPVRSIGNIMGKNVDWDGNKKLVSLSDPLLENPDALKDNDNSVIVWEDKNFEAIMRCYLNNFDKDIYIKDLNDITKLTISSNWKIETNIKECEMTEEYQNKIGLITSMKDIDNFNNLNEITIYHNEIDSIYKYKNSSNISSLNLSFNKIQNLSGIENYGNLINLDISDNYIENLKPLNNLSQLRTLDLSYIGPPVNIGYRNSISNIDINTISELTNLESLIIQNSNISNISALNKFNYLKSLDLFECNLNIDELYLISDNDKNIIETLAFIDISNISGEPAVLDMSKFKNLNNLRYLHVSGGLKNINSLNNLDSLDMIDNFIGKDESFSNLENLEWLKVLNSKFEDPTVLEDLNKLETVYFSETDISSLKYLKNNKNLKSLWIVNGNLSDISDLKEFANLENIMVPNNNITDISVLSELHNLKRISIIDNPINDYTVIDNLTNKEEIQIIK